MSPTTSTIRASNHNNWPAIELFSCEKEFIARLAKLNFQQIFVTATLSASDDDEPFNSAVGHLLDCLDSLPRRPDAAFDSLYKVIDQNLKSFKKSELSPAMAAVDQMFDEEPCYWSATAQLLASHAPLQTAEYAAARILECKVVANPPHSGRLMQRAGRSMGQRRYDQFCNRFLVQNPQDSTLFELPYKNKRNAGRLMHKLLTRTAPSVNPVAPAVAWESLWDLSVQANLLSPREKICVLLEICLATYRHERFHGEAFSPFRSSKATLKTYAHAYYVLIVSYIVVLGMLQYQKKGGLTGADIYEVAKESMARFRVFFSDVLLD